MRTSILTLVACALLAASAAADDKKDKAPAVREIAKGEAPGQKGADVMKPVAAANADELAKAIADKDVRDKVAKDVDFAKEQVVYFLWLSQVSDKLVFKVEEGKKGPVVVFTHTPGTTEEVSRVRYRVYAIPKDAIWRVEKAK